MPKILVADDNSNIQKMVTLALKEQGIDVVAVGNGEAAVRKMPDIFPDLVLADIFMPVRNGYEVCQFVKNDPRFAHVPVILLVGAFDPLDEQEAHRVGADGVLKKPFVPPEPLINMVKAALQKSAAERLAPVVASVPAPVAAGLAPQHEEEPPHEDFGVVPARVTLSGDNHPLAFGEMLETPTEEAEPETEHTEPSRFRGAGLADIPWGRSPLQWTSAEEPAATPAPPAAQDQLKPAHGAAHELHAEVSAPELSPAPAAGAADSASLAPPLPAAPAEEVSHPSAAMEFLAPGVSVEEEPFSAHPIEGVSAGSNELAATEFVPAESSAESSTASRRAPPAEKRWESFESARESQPAAPQAAAPEVSAAPEIASEPVRQGAPSTHSPAWSDFLGEILVSESAAPTQAAPGASAPPAASSAAPSLYSAEPILEITSSGSAGVVAPPANPSATHEPQGNAPEPPAAFAESFPAIPSTVPEHVSPELLQAASAADSPMQSFGVPHPADPAVVEAVVAKVLERMQPQILDIVTKEIFKPVVEALVRRELDKR